MQHGMQHHTVQIESKSFQDPHRAGSDKFRGYCLEMICADFLAGANLENENPDVLLRSALRFCKFLSGEERKTFFDHVAEEPSSIWSASSGATR